MFLTTKLGHPDRIRERLEDSVSKIDPSTEGYIDLCLIHSPTAGPKGRREQWAIMEEMVNVGKVRSIGVSN